MSEMAAFLMRYYGLSEATAMEVVGELRDVRSLESLAGFRRVAQRCVRSAPPNDLLGPSVPDSLLASEPRPPKCVDLPLVGVDERTNSF